MKRFMSFIGHWFIIHHSASTGSLVVDPEHIGDVYPDVDDVDPLLDGELELVVVAVQAEVPDSHPAMASQQQGGVQWLHGYGLNNINDI